MSGRVERIEFNNAGFEAILKSPEVIADLLARGQRIASSATTRPGAVFSVDAQVGRSRAQIRVATGNDAAREAEAHDRALVSSLDAGR